MSFSSPNPSRDQSPARLSLSHSRYLDSPAGQNLSDGESEQDEDEEEPVELNEFEMDAINSRVGSGAVTPAVGSSRPYPVVAAGLPRQKESRVVIKGTAYIVTNDEIGLPSDPRGELKVDMDGNLMDGREYKLKTFTSPFRPSSTKLYMLSIDAARAAGFRDSLYFFRRNVLIHKLSCSQMEKDRLIELGSLGTALKSRSVTIVSARNVFKVLGAAVILNGKYIFDDYYEDASLAAGHTPGELAFVEPYDPSKDNGTLAGRKGPPLPGTSNVARPKIAKAETSASSGLKEDLAGGASNIGFGGSGAQPFARGSADDPNVAVTAGAKKSKSGAAVPVTQLTETNWMLEYAHNVRDANRALGQRRKDLIGEVRLDLEREEGEEEYWIEGAEYGVGEEEAEIRQAKKVERDATRLKLRLADNGDADEDDDDDEEAEEAAAIVAELNKASTIKRDTSRATSKVVPLEAPPAKRRRIYNPIRGIIDPETFSPLVYSSTQSTRATIQRLSGVPQISSSDTSLPHEPHYVGMNDQNDEAARLKYGLKARKIGIASIEVVVADADSDARRPDLIPGMWDFRT